MGVAGRNGRGGISLTRGDWFALQADYVQKGNTVEMKIGLEARPGASNCGGRRLHGRWVRFSGKHDLFCVASRFGGGARALHRFRFRTLGTPPTLLLLFHFTFLLLDECAPFKPTGLVTVSFFLSRVFLWINKEVIVDPWHLIKEYVLLMRTWFRYLHNNDKKTNFGYRRRMTQNLAHLRGSLKLTLSALCHLRLPRQWSV